MKLTVFFNPLWCFELSADTYAQTDSISLDLSNATCKEALDAIKKQTKLDFFYNNQEIMPWGKFRFVARMFPWMRLCGKSWERISRSGLLITRLLSVRKKRNRTPCSNGLRKGSLWMFKDYLCRGWPFYWKVRRGNFDRYGWKIHSFFPNTAGTVLQFSFIGMKTTEVTFSGQAEAKNCVGRGNYPNGRGGGDRYFRT